MRALLKLLLILIVLSPFALVALVWFSFSETPITSATSTLSHQDVARARKIIVENDPRTMPAGARKTIKVDQSDAALTLRYLMQFAGGSADAYIDDYSARLKASVRVPTLPGRQYLNLSMAFTEGTEPFGLEDLRLGAVAIPNWLTDKIWRLVLQRLDSDQQLRALLAALHQVEFEQGLASLTYTWDPELMEHGRDAFFVAVDQGALRAYISKFSRMGAAGSGHNRSMSSLLSSLFKLAQQRSTDGEAAAENRALLVMLGAWAGGQNPNRLLEDESDAADLPSYDLLVQGRGDLGQHFLTSAGLAAVADSTLSDAIGLLKEMEDSDGGSGFSFTDLAADRAGTRFGRLATSSDGNAKRVQAILAKGIVDADVIPRVTDLPERMSLQVFESRFGGVGGARYKEMLAEIENRIDRCAIFSR